MKNSTPDMATTLYTYDALDRTTEVNGPRTEVDDRITYAYDRLDRLVTVTQPGVTLPSSSTPVSVTITYDDAGERVRVQQPMTTALTLDRHWTYDSDGNLATFADAAGTTTYTTNLAGWVTQVADPRPQTVHLGYDRLGRRVCRHTAACTGSTSAAETFAYDAAGNLTQAKNPSATFNMVYDDDGRLTTVSNGSTVETTYTFNATTGLLSSIADVAGTTPYTYNAAGQLLTMDDPFNTGTKKSTYTYDSAGRVIKRADDAADLIWNRTYDPAGRIDTQTITDEVTPSIIRASFDLGYDKASNVTSKVSTVQANPSNGTWAYTYDGANRMLTATGPNASGAQTTWTYGWDGASNRISYKVGAGTPVTTTYSGAGHPVSSDDGTTFTTDAIGNLTKIDPPGTANDRAYAYDASSRMTCAKVGTACSGTGQVTYTLDALDRVLTRVGTATKTFTYSGMGETIAKTVEGTNTLTYIHTLGGGSPLAQKKGSAIRWYLRDPHGDVVGLITPTGGNQGTVAFDPWGTKLGTTGTETSAFGFQGDLTDQTTGQVDMQTRWYEPQIGRFTTRDVLFGDSVSPPSLNQFAYTSGSPVTYWDPFGMTQEASETQDCGGARCRGTNPEGEYSSPGCSGGCASPPASSCTTYLTCGGEVATPQVTDSPSVAARTRTVRLLETDPETITGGPATFFIESVVVEVRTHGNEWDIDLTVGGHVTTVNQADVEFSLKAEILDVHGRRLRMAATGPCFGDPTCDPSRVRLSNQTTYFFHSHQPSGRPIRIEVTFSAVNQTARGPILPVPALLNNQHDIPIEWG